jgi:micrococcal nuclease
VRSALALAVAATLAALACAEAAAPERRPARVLKVIDGDTLDVELDGRSWRVRLIGVDAPESHDSAKLDRLVARGHDRQAVMALGRRATAFARERLSDGHMALELDVDTRDRYGRLLAYVWLPDGTLLNAALLEHGQARLLTIPPNVRYVDRLVPLERDARRARRGMWATPTRAAPAP